MRRVVTGLDASGKGTVLSDGPPQAVFGISGPDADHLTIVGLPDVPERIPDGQTAGAELWASDASPARSDQPDLTTGLDFFHTEPLGTGITWLYSTWGAHTESGFHQTKTLDLVFVVAGSIELLLEDESVILLEQGDTVVIPGLVHAWRTGEHRPTLLQVIQKLA
ncbi:quercetin dioxygenase-like cupin family protein [Kibdelosporangium banguiense]|uniref:Quercetin dioxygenase-like cupin family protein n=1 Tax=Kibdelosporangium banguiense TaxID=1365924 RepID=A0ABS4TW92_9PSEU|nr:hypothetical protein [Kibdelosporangium banguiense]MBP2328682.1 quercetin dioxygenase-like cupin family protein [Kibdelosporangium banguiense]